MAPVPTAGHSWCSAATCGPRDGWGARWRLRAPTHQPIEHVWALRAIPGLNVVRPGDANETVIAWRTILERAEPAALCLTRQNLPVLDRTGDLASAEEAVRGGYVLAAGTDVIL